MGTKVFGVNRIITDGLVLHLDAANKKSYGGTGTTWNDISGYKNNGTLVNGPTYEDGSIKFDGINDYSKVNDNDTLNITESLTISTWFKSVDIQSVQSVVNKFKQLVSLYYGYSLIISPNNHPFVQIGNGSNSKYYNFTNLIYSIGVWENITYTFFDGSVTCFLNDETETITGFPTTIGINSDSLLIGVKDDETQYFNGDIGNIKIYNKTLSATEILQNYNALKSRFK